MRNPARQKPKPADANPTTIPVENSKQGVGRRKTKPSDQLKAKNKTERVLALLSREGGASIVDLTSATDWLPHTTRAALTGLRKRGHVIEAEREKDGPTVYRLIPPAPAKASRRASKSKAKA